MTHAHIIAAVRTPQAKFLGSLSSLSAAALGAHAIRALNQRAGWESSTIDQVIMGQVVSAGAGQAPARQAATQADLPPTVGAVTVNKVCGSGLYSVMLADMAIRAGQYQRVIAGGMESMSQAPHLMSNSRTGCKFGPSVLRDALEIDGLHCATSRQSMINIAQQLAWDQQISRDDQDAWALRSHQRACAAQVAGHFQAEVVEVVVESRKAPSKIQHDEGPRADCSLPSLSNLRSVATLTGNDGTHYVGSVTAGNSSSLADGAAAVAVVDASTAKSLNPSWAFRIVAHTTFAGPHEHLFTAPAHAIRRLLEKTGRTLADIDLIEINEAFAAQIVACSTILSLDSDTVNVHGGAIALGHPLGCSGTRILVTLIHALLAGNLSTGIAALCLGGGEAVAMLIERV